MLAAALAVALAGEAAVAGIGFAALAECEGQVDEGRDVVGAVALLFCAAGGQDHGGGGLAQHVRGTLDQRGRHAGDAFDPVRPIGFGGTLHGGEAGCAGFDEGVVRELVAYGHVQQAQGQGRVRAGGERQMEVGGAGGCGLPRIGDDQAAAVIPLRLEILHDRRHGLGGIAAGQ